MAQIRKAEGQAKIRCHADKFFDAWARKPYCVSKLCPSKISSVQLLEGDWHVAGAKLTWNYTIGARTKYDRANPKIIWTYFDQRASVTTIVEKMDEQNKTVHYNLVDGLIMKQDYKSCREKFEVIPAGEGCIVKWSIEYEKMRENAPDADIYIKFLLDCAKEIDAKLCAT